MGAKGVGERAAALSVGRKGLEAEAEGASVGEGGAPTAQAPREDRGNGGAAQAEAELRSAPEEQLRGVFPWEAAGKATL